MNKNLNNQIDNDLIDFFKKCMIMIDEKKSIDPVFLDLRNINSYLSYFLILSGNSQTHCRSLAKEAVKFMSKYNIHCFGKPDYSSEWIALDFGETVIHIFTEEMRKEYELEKLWSDAERIK